MIIFRHLFSFARHSIRVSAKSSGKISPRDFVIPCASLPAVQTLLRRIFKKNNRCAGAVFALATLPFTAIPLLLPAQDSDFSVERPVHFIDLTPQPPPPSISGDGFQAAMVEPRVSQDPKLLTRELSQPFYFETSLLPDVPARWRYDLEMFWRDEFRPQSVGWEQLGGIRQRASLKFDPWQTLAFEGALESGARVAAATRTDLLDRAEVSIALAPLPGTRIRLLTGLAGFQDVWLNTRTERYVRLQVDQTTGPLTLHISPGLVEEIPGNPGAPSLLRNELEASLVWHLSPETSLATGWNQQIFARDTESFFRQREQYYSRLEQLVTRNLSVRWVIGLENVTEEPSGQSNGRLTLGLESFCSLGERIRGALQIQRAADIDQTSSQTRPDETLFLLSLAGDF